MQTCRCVQKSSEHHGHIVIQQQHIATQAWHSGILTTCHYQGIQNSWLYIPNGFTKWCEVHCFVKKHVQPVYKVPAKLMELCTIDKTPRCLIVAHTWCARNSIHTNHNWQQLRTASAHVSSHELKRNQKFHEETPTVLYFLFDMTFDCRELHRVLSGGLSSCSFKSKRTVQSSTWCLWQVKKLATCTEPLPVQSLAVHWDELNKCALNSHNYLKLHMREADKDDWF